jgi:DNA-binding MarR family transcriptional regulator
MEPALGDGELEGVRAVAALRSALRRFDRRTEEACRRCQVTPQWYSVLLLIKGAADGSERSTVGQLASELHRPQTTVTDLVQRAERAGLVERTVDAADRRRSLLRLTAEGEQRLACVYRTLDADRRLLATELDHTATLARLAHAADRSS